MSSSTNPTTTPHKRTHAPRNLPPSTSTLTEDFETSQKRQTAAAILESTEILFWYSNARNESLPQTRRHFTNIVAGIDSTDSDVEWYEEHELSPQSIAQIEAQFELPRERRDKSATDSPHRKKRKSGGVGR